MRPVAICVVNEDEPQITEQSERFLEAARQAGVDENADIDEVMRRLAAQKRAEKPN